jgi:hypothetical protein
MRLAIEGRGTYVEGFAMSAPGQSAIHHAWITTDNVHAMDLTWTNPELFTDPHYFGIPFPLEVLTSILANSTRYWTALIPQYIHLLPREGRGPNQNQ